MSQKDNKNIKATELSTDKIPFIVTNDLEAENELLRKEIEEWKEKYNRLLQETELLRNPVILKALPLSIPVEKLPTSKELAIHQKVSKTYIQLPNGTQGKEYQFLMDISKFGLYELNFFDLTGLEICGLTFDNISKIIKGTPTTSGDFQIKLRYKFTDENDENPFLEKSIALIINPDPRSLWKNLPSDQTDKYWKPDNEQLLINVGEKQIVVASQRGRSHAQEGKFRDDHFSIYYNEVSKWTLAVVADGAGSAQYSRQGSLLACNTITQYFKDISKEKYQELETAVENFHIEGEKSKPQLKTLLYKYLAGAAYKAYKIIEQEAVLTETKVKDFGTTIIFSIFKKYDFGWFVASFGVGDSPMGIFINGEKPIIMHYPEEGEYSGQTYFLTMPEIFKESNEIANRISYKIVPDFTAMILMTDGIYDPKFQTKTNLDKGELWKDLWEDLNNQIDFSKGTEKASAQLLAWLDFWSAGNHDDRTLAIIY
jgi:serine/threonine protein phosphatase PrpC